MKVIRPGKLVQTWFVLMLSLPLSILWIRSDFIAGNAATAILKLSVILALASAAGLIFTYAMTQSWSQPTRRFTQFVSKLPAEETELSENGPPEIQNLSQALKAMAERVRQVVERANLELSRRETILACMAEGVLAVDKDLKVIFCNNAFAQAFSARIPVAEGRTLYEVVREPLLREILERVLKRGTAETDRFQLPTAARRWFEARALPLGEGLGRGAVIVLHDVTDIQRQEQLRKDFVADVSHELRTPLAAIRGYAETLLDGALEDSANNRKFVEIILSHTIRLNNIASDLLVLSELDSDAGPPLPPQRISIRDTIDSALRTVENGAAARNISLNSSNCHDCAVIGFRFRLEQVLVNLLDNAVKFNRPGGEVTIECGQSADRVQLTVADTGIGIPSEEIRRIFERFYRVDKARSRPAGGTGLGLPIVKEVVDRMGGTVTVESQLGRGSKFTILLPSA